jgi:hypothetical protein
VAVPTSFRLVLAGGALAVLVLSCSSQAPTVQQNPSTQAQQRTPTLGRWNREETKFALGTRVGLDHEFAKDLTRSAVSTDEWDRRVAEPARERTRTAEYWATMSRQRDRDVKECILAGNDGTLCQLNPYDQDLIQP